MILSGNVHWKSGTGHEFVHHIWSAALSSGHIKLQLHAVCHLVIVLNVPSSLPPRCPASSATQRLWELWVMQPHFLCQRGTLCWRHNKPKLLQANLFGVCWLVYWICFFSPTCSNDLQWNVSISYVWGWVLQWSGPAGPRGARGVWTVWVWPAGARRARAGPRARTAMWEPARIFYSRVCIKVGVGMFTFFKLHTWLHHDAMQHVSSMWIYVNGSLIHVSSMWTDVWCHATAGVGVGSSVYISNAKKNSVVHSEPPPTTYVKTHLVDCD